ncbi:hypothetical protein AURDEDRAFT_111126 [Auricularia subglabra TFB-10046 SS5]|nr:hypothetical protein AURDEDRAFT_111126 [Auricularia subglabra TFB-10046 SS5]
MWAVRALAVSALAAVARVRAYIPAVAVNLAAGETPQPFGRNMSTLSLQWPPQGFYNEAVYYLQAGGDSQGLQQGVLVHFNEKNLTNITMPSLTPWVAFIQCDHNVTGYSEDIDIFTFARDRGAVAALLYSNKSQTCEINDAYRNPDEFERVLDVFAMSSLDTTKVVISQFTNVNQTLYADYNATRLNQTAGAVHRDLMENDGRIDGPYLVVTLRAFNSTANLTHPGDNNTPDDPPPKSSKGQTGLAMIILYAITGCVSVLFCVVIAAGAIRAIRHPERYGPRAADPTMGPAGAGQSRAGGLTRAILDTFPVIKYAVAPSSTVAASAPSAKPPGDEESRSSADEIQLKNVARERWLSRDELSRRDDDEIVMVNMPTAQDAEGSRSSMAAEDAPPVRPALRTTTTAAAEASTSSAAASPITAAAAAVPAPDASVGREACPICILDFQEGEDVRVLPCKGHHMFHRDCVDPWLLDSSGSCPLCREDFHMLENVLDPDGEGHGHTHTHAEGEPGEGTSLQPPPQRRRPLTGLFRFKRRPTSSMPPMDDNDLPT